MFETILTIDGYEYDIRINYTYTPGYPETRLEPPEFATVELDLVELKDGDHWTTIDLPTAVSANIEQDILENVYDGH